MSNYMVPTTGNSVSYSHIIVGFSPGDETCVIMRGSGNGAFGTVYPIDTWK